MSIVCLNGVLLSDEEARIPATDPGFLFGAGVYESLRVINGVGFLLERHYERLADSAARLGVTVPFHLDTLRYLVRQLEDANLLAEGHLCITLSRGGAGIEEDGEPNYLIQMLSATPLPPAYRATCAPSPRSAKSPLAGLHTTSALDLRLVHEEAWAQGFDEVLLLDDRGRLVEGASTNVFVMRGGRATTPPLRLGATPGVTRRFLVESLPGWGIPVREATLSLRDLETADEVFCTSALVGVMPISQVEGKSLGSAQAGTRTREIAAAYRRAQSEYVQTERARV